MKKVIDFIIVFAVVVIMLYALLVSAGLLPESVNIMNLNPYLW